MKQWLVHKTLEGRQESKKLVAGIPIIFCFQFYLTYATQAYL